MYKRQPEACAKRAREYVDMGFTAVKLDPLAPYLDSYAVHMPSRESLLRAERNIAGIREAVVENCDIIIGTNGQCTAAGAIRVAKCLEKYDPLWFEEPTPPENFPVLKKVSEATTIPVSYTHLDVYKRQSLGKCAGTQSRITPIPWRWR